MLETSNIYSDITTYKSLMTINKFDLKEFIRNKLNRSLYKSAYSRSFYTLWGVVIKEIGFSFNQFYTWKYPVRSFLRVMSIILSSFIRFALGRSLKYSFAFTGEDRIIEGILKPLITDKGYYVDVGCNHPIFLSNTYNFYRRGWKGICVDANERLIKKYALYRPNDLAVQALVSDKIEERSFYLCQNDVLSTTEQSNLEYITNEGLTYESKEFLSVTLTSILDQNNFVKKFDILSVDVEEHDLQVLKSLDFEKYCPKLVIVEDETFEFSTQEENAINIFLKSRGYLLIGSVLKNQYYLKDNKFQ